jgi:S1-C subfamily serine protease
VPRLGILATDLDEKVMPFMPPLRKLSGAVVLGVVGDGAGAASGVRIGDVIYEINNRPIKSLKDLMEACRDLKPDKAVVLQIERSGQLQFVAVDID